MSLKAPAVAVATAVGGGGFRYHARPATADLFA